MRTKRPPRLREFDYLGPQAYFLTICTFERSRLFEIPPCVTSARDQLLHTAADYRFAVIAYCFMPDHVHALTEGLADDSDFRRFVAMFKQRSSFHWRKQSGTPLWQEGYYEHVLREVEYQYPEIVAYILNNPVRAGLCRSPGAYPWSGSDRYTFAALADLVQDSRLPWI